MRWVIGSGLRLAVSMYGKYGESGCSARGKFGEGRAVAPGDQALLQRDKGEEMTHRAKK